MRVLRFGLGSSPVLWVLSACLAASQAWAADTTEPWAQGAADVEFYVGSGGVGGGAAEALLFGDLLLGYGVAERLSLFLGTRLEADGTLSAGTPGLRMGVLGTPVDTAVLDLDLVLEVGASGLGLGEIAVVPGLELNADLGSPLGAWGVYLRAQAPLGAGEAGASYQLDFTPGLYWTVSEGHQLLAEYRASLMPRDGDGPWRWESAGVALGYNVVLTETLELVSELSAGPLRGEVRLGAMLGIIATLP